MFRKFLKGDNDVERCGVFIGTLDYKHVRPSRSLRPIELPNRHPTPAESYRITKSDLDRCLEARSLSMSDVAGFWHTHPAPFLPGPSQADLDSIMLGATHWWHCVVHIESWTLTWYDYFDNNIKENDNAWNLVRPRPTARVGRVRRPER